MLPRAVPVAGLVLTLAGSALSAQAVPRVETSHLRGAVHLLRYVDSAGVINLAAAAGADGLVLVDHPGDWRTLTVDSGAVARVREALEHLGGALRWLINTHWHGDHSGGNVLYGRGGVTVVAHENTWHRLVERQTPSWYPDGIGPMEPDGWPTVTFADSLRLGDPGEPVVLYHFGPAHTDGDAIVYFPSARVAHLGDLYHGWEDLSLGIDMIGLARTLGEILTRLPADALLITGHGTVQPREDLANYHGMLAASIVHVRQQMARGATLEAIRDAGLPAPWDARWTGDREWLGTWLEEIYQTLSAQR